MKVSVVGLGKLGVPMAACLAARGLDVIGIDNDPVKVRAINEGRVPVHEPGLTELLAQARGRFSAGMAIEDAVRETEATFIAVATPSEPGGGFSLPPVEQVLRAIGGGRAK